MTGKVKCTCGWSWNKSDSSKKDMYICHECGRDNSNNMKNGGWLDNYNDSQASAPEGMEGDGFSNVGRNSSPAWGGQFQNGGKAPKYVESKNDPRYKAYQDSLSLYNYSNRNKKFVGDYLNGNLGEAPSELLHKLDDNTRNSFKDIAYHEQVENKFNKIKPIHKTNVYSSAQGIKNNLIFTVPSWKKPQQQVIVKPTTTKKTTKPSNTGWTPLTKEIAKGRYEGDLKNMVYRKKSDGNYDITYQAPPEVSRQPIQAIQNNLRPAGLVQGDFDIDADAEIQPEVRHAKSWKYNTREGRSEESGYVNSPEDMDYYSRLRDFYQIGAGKGLGNKVEITPHYQMGGSVYPVNYVPQAQEGKELTFLQPTSDKLPQGYRIPYADPSSERAMSIGGENGEPAYLIPSFKYGKPLYDPIGEFRKTKEHLGGPFKTWQEADEWEKTVRHPAVEKGENIMFPQEKFAMGGTIAGAPGFSYARTQGAAPSNGKYAKKTMASAQNGKEMQYYQNGLDFKPKTISKNGSWLSKYDVAQAGAQVQYGTPEYEEAYNKGEVVTDEGGRSPILLDEVVVPSKPLTEFGKTRKEIAAKNKWEDYAQKYLGNFEKNMGQTLENLPESRKQEYEDYINKLAFDEYIKIHPQLKGEERGAYIDRMQTENANSSNFERAYEANADYNDATDVNKWRKGLIGLGSLVLPKPAMDYMKQESDYFSKKEKQAMIDNPISTQVGDVMGTLEPLSIPVEGIYGNKSFGDIASGESADIPMSARLLGDPLMLGFEAAPLIGEGFNAAKIALTTEEGLLSNTYKYNPWAFKPNSEAYYRGIGKSGFDQAIETGVISGRPNSTFGEDVYMSSMLDVAKRYGKDFRNPFNKNFFVEGPGNKTSYIAEIPRTSLTNPNSPIPYNVGTEQYPTYFHEFKNPKPIPLDNVKLLKEHWLQRYKEVGNPTSGFRTSVAPELRQGLRTNGQSFGSSIETPQGFENRVFDKNVQLGEYKGIGHLSEPGYNYRVLSPKEIDAIRESKGVFPRIGKQKGGNQNVKYWTKGNKENWFGDKADLETIRVNKNNFSSDKVVNSKHVEVYDKQTNKFKPLKQGGIIKDDRGQWDHPDEPTRISGGNITMKPDPLTGKPLTKPILGIADTGEEQMMYPGEDYNFEGAEYVDEYPKGKRPKKAQNGLRQEQKGLQNLDNLTNFTNYNKPQPGGWLNKYN
jgi:hypothetical protein